MARTNTTTGLENRAQQRIFASPVALAFVRTVVARRGVTEAQARRIYLDYLNRAQPHRRGARTAA
jgi:predicted LPLAT superfamily acyltransferase